MNARTRSQTGVDRALAFALAGAVMSTVSLLFLSGRLGVALAVLGCALCVYSLRYPEKRTGMVQNRNLTPHGDEPRRFLLVQGVGTYDRHPVEPSTWKAEAASDRH